MPTDSLRTKTCLEGVSDFIHMHSSLPSREANQRQLLPGRQDDKPGHPATGVVVCLRLAPKDQWLRIVVAANLADRSQLCLLDHDDEEDGDVPEAPGELPTLQLPCWVDWC